MGRARLAWTPYSARGRAEPLDVPITTSNTALSISFTEGYLMNEAIISTKGQIVIPQEFRDRYHLKPNTKACWVDTGSGLLLVPQIKDPILQSRGLLKNSKLTQRALKKERNKDKNQN